MRRARNGEAVYPQSVTAKEPGDRGAGRRKYRSEHELAEDTDCPAFHTRELSYAWIQAAMGDGTTCAGPACKHWAASIKRDNDGKPIRAEVCCTAHGKTNAMGIIEPRAAAGKKGGRRE